MRGDGKAVLSRAIAAFEAGTAAELVIVVEPRAGHYLHVPLGFGAAAAFASLAFLLYGEPSFGLHWFLIDPLIAGAFVGYLAGGWTGLERVLTPAKRRAAWVLRAARAAFTARRVADTRGRTGVLVYVAAGERAAVVLADLGVRQVVPEAEWEQACAPLIAAVGRGQSAAEVAPLIAAIGAVCGRHLPRQEDDVNELSDEVDS